MKAVCEDIDDLFYNIHSAADVRCWLAKKYMHVKSQKAENENSTEDPNVNVTSNTSSQNYESMNAGLEVT